VQLVNIFQHVQCCRNNFERILDVVTWKIKHWNNSEITSAFSFTGNHRHCLHVKYNAEIISKIFQNNFISHVTTALSAFLNGQQLDEKTITTNIKSGTQKCCSLGLWNRRRDSSRHSLDKIFRSTTNNLAWLHSQWCQTLCICAQDLSLVQFAMATEAQC